MRGRAAVGVSVPGLLTVAAAPGEVVLGVAFALAGLRRPRSWPTSASPQ